MAPPALLHSISVNVRDEIIRLVLNTSTKNGKVVL